MAIRVLLKLTPISEMASSNASSALMICRFIKKSNVLRKKEGIERNSLIQIRLVSELGKVCTSRNNCSKARITK